MCVCCLVFGKKSVKIKVTTIDGSLYSLILQLEKIGFAWFYSLNSLYPLKIAWTAPRHLNLARKNFEIAFNSFKSIENSLISLKNSRNYKNCILTTLTLPPISCWSHRVALLSSENLPIKQQVLPFSYHSVCLFSYHRPSSISCMKKSSMYGSFFLHVYRSSPFFSRAIVSGDF